MYTYMFLPWSLSKSESVFYCEIAISHDNHPGCLPWFCHKVVLSGCALNECWLLWLAVRVKMSQGHLDTSTADGLRQAGQKGESLERWGVDSYGGFLSHAGTPKSSIVRSFLVLKAMVTWGSTILRNPPYIYVTGVGHSQALG